LKPIGDLNSVWQTQKGQLHGTAKQTAEKLTFKYRSG